MLLVYDVGRQKTQDGSWVQFINSPSCMARLVISLPGMESSTPTIRP